MVIFLLNNIKKRINMSRKPKIALFLDGPNLLRKEFEIDLNQIRDDLEEYGSVRELKVFLNQFAPDKLIEAIANHGFEPIIGVGEKKDDIASDVDVYVATAAISAIYNPHIDIIALATRDADFLPVIQLAKRLGKKAYVIGLEPGFSKALQQAADKVIILKTKEQRKKIKKKD
ncbi:MAG: TIGR00288 family NYN domain-containing protein [Nanohaloarchaea archaeon]|nr:TIGR00288 family NYN domain-containing protein [Candidatus Nanohaloarchaea archaeon]